MLVQETSCVESAGHWDTLAALMGGHPLQSCLWGLAATEGRRRRRVFCLSGGGDGSKDWLARVEERRVPCVGRIGWIPRGPVVCGGEAFHEVVLELCCRLKALGFCLAAMSPWLEVDAALSASLERLGAITASRQRTIWVDLTQGHERLWAGLDKQWRYGVGRAHRFGVTVAPERQRDSVEAFFALCQRLSAEKGFRLPGSSAQLFALLAAGRHGDVEARLFIARYKGELAAGVFLLRSGRSVHYIWGGADRAFSKQRVGEAVQWAAIEWGLSQGCDRYDLEGIDPTRNPGTYHFKKKMGGREVDLPGEIILPLNRRGRVLAALLSRRQ